MKIIGISGKKQSGKSFLAQNLVGLLRDDNFSNYEVIRMADALKRTVIDCFVPPSMNIAYPDQLDSDKLKAKILPCGYTTRHLLQQIGTEMFRGLWPDVWVNAWRRQVTIAEEHEMDFVICPDVRFPNELKAIHDMGGVVIRLTRAPFADVDQHESETALDEIEYVSLHDVADGGYVVGGFDYVMNNKDFTMDDARRWAKDFVTENYPDYV